MRAVPLYVFHPAGGVPIGARLPEAAAEADGRAVAGADAGADADGRGVADADGAAVADGRGVALADGGADGLTLAGEEDDALGGALLVDAEA